MEQVTRPAPATEPPANEEQARRDLAEQVAARIQQELASDLEKLRARLGLGSARRDADQP
ncbi:MAG TPA: hypothetical protein VF665_25095 [Longimicrobium sp.]|jgi:hypothetical protein|uniref:hypothetical protein n=1 Tax=Longimicrobium sp. TaxID=2029185 RepID=UPI002ED80381